MVRVIASILLAAFGLQAAEKFALVIGIAGYPQFPAERRLKYADEDAREFAEFLKTAAAGAFLPANVRLLTNGKATRAGIKREIAWLGARTTSDDIVYVYFAGHGVTDSLGRAYLMPWDGAPEQPDIAGIGADEFIRDLRLRVSAKQLIFFVDACHAGATLTSFGLADRDAANTTPAILQSWQRELASRKELTIAFLSASANQRSYEDDKVRHGLFTWYLLEGLKGKADRNHDGKVTASELRRFVVDGVEDHTESKQSPVTSPGFDPQMVLAIYQIAPSSTGNTTRSTPPAVDRANPRPSLGTLRQETPAAPKPAPPSSTVTDLKRQSRTLKLQGVPGFGPVPAQRSGFLGTAVLPVGPSEILVTPDGSGGLQFEYFRLGTPPKGTAIISCSGLSVSSSGARVKDPSGAWIENTAAVLISSRSGAFTYYVLKNQLKAENTKDIREKLQELCNR